MIDAPLAAAFTAGMVATVNPCGFAMLPAYLTFFMNGIVIHNRKALLGWTSHRILTDYEEHPEVGPLELQDHGDLVRFRNIWYRPLKDYDEA